MKKLSFIVVVLLALLFSGVAFSQSDFRTTAALSAACTNATTACDATANSQLKVPVISYSWASVTVSGTYTGVTVFFEYSDDGGTTWFQDTCTRGDAAVQEGTEVLPNSTTRGWDCGVPASTNFRVRVAAISTGTVNAAVTISAAQIEPAPTVAIAIQPTSFAIFSNPAAASQATISQAAGGAGVRNVATAVCFSAGATTAPALTALTVNLRDGATGAGTVKWTHEVIIPAATGQSVAPFCAPVNVIGSANTTMTLEFSGALANLIESVSLQGYTTTF